MLASLSGLPAQRWSPAGLATVVALHGVVFHALLQMNVIRLPVELPLLQVELLTPPAPELPKPEIVPPQPRPVEKRPVPRPVQEVAPLAIPAAAPVSAPTVEMPAVPPAPTFAPPAPPRTRRAKQAALRCRLSRQPQAGLSLRLTQAEGGRPCRAARAGRRERLADGCRAACEQRFRASRSVGAGNSSPLEIRARSARQ